MNTPDLVIQSDLIMRAVFEFILPFFRIAAFMSVIPLLGSRMVPQRVRLMLTLALTALVVPLLDNPIPVDFSLVSVLMVAKEILIGVAMAFTVVLFFHVFSLAGQLVALQMGLGFASMIDPSNGVSVPIVSQFFTILVGLLFITGGGHLLVIEALVGSFQLLPINAGWDIVTTAYGIFSAGSWLFAAALLVALPTVTAILIVNLSFGVMTRAAPQLNIFSLGFPFTLVFGVLILWVSMQGFLAHYQRISVEAFALLRSLL